MNPLSTRSDLLSLVAGVKADTGVSDAELCRRAGLSPNALYMLRRQPV